MASYLQSGIQTQWNVWDGVFNENSWRAVPVNNFRKRIRLRVRSHERRNELIPVWDFKPAWKQVLFTWSFISAAFQSDPIFWWTCVGISFRVVFTWYFITRNEMSFLSKWPIWNPYRFESYFTLIHVNTSKDLTEQRSETFNRNEISYRFKFDSPLMWTYSYIPS